jgi:uncharacterized protein (TIGR03435 family)
MISMMSAVRLHAGRGLLLAAGMCFAGSLGLAQVAAVPAAAPLQGADGRPLAFDVISVRENKFPPTPQNPPMYGPTPDGYRMKDYPLIFVILTAYVPSQGSDAAAYNRNQVTGLPAWLPPLFYDIDAKVAEVDLPRWRDPAQRPAMLRAMLQAMLADRFKLVAHRENKEVPVYELTVGKNGSKLKPSETTVLADIQKKYPSAGMLPSGMIVAPGAVEGQTTYFGVTMPVFCRMLSGMAGRPVVDKTGLTGKYDITEQIEMPPSAQDSASAPLDPSSQVFYIVQDQLGLHLAAAKGTVESLVIDHLERPSDN